MKKVKVETDAIIFSDEEIKRLTELLKYCNHRILCHRNSSGISHIEWAEGFIEYMLKNL